MELFPFFKSILQQDTAPVVICDLEHTILYMNPAAIDHYAGFGGADLLGKCLLDCHNPRSVQMINRVLDWFRAGDGNNCVHTFFSQKESTDIYMIALRDDASRLIGYYEKHELRERDMSGFYAMN